ncbi:MAG: hypothetical protein GC149_01680 [Gammaproteobacteria bacterium]|nr:hypothetical protein [Gammaproteobacteria bacterium]
MSAASQTYTRTMSITHADFLRSLLPLKKYYHYQINNAANRIQISDEQRIIQILLGTEGAVAMGSLRMPSTEVTFTFRGFTPSERDLFWSRFDLCFRRGGG